MRIFAPSLPDSMPRSAVPVEILRRLAFGRPQPPAIQATVPVLPAVKARAAEAVPDPGGDSVDLDQRVRQSGEW